MADAERLFAVDDIPEVPLFREPRRSKAARGSVLDGRFKNDYPADWHRCTSCGGSGAPILPRVDVEVERGHASISCSAGQGGNWARVTHTGSGLSAFVDGDESGLANVEEALRRLQPQLRAAGYVCPDCLGTGSLKARVRLEAGHRCARCLHPYMPKGDAKMLGVEPSPFHWSPCDERCSHSGPIRYRFGDEDWCDFGTIADGGWATVDRAVFDGAEVQAEWRILTVHHLDGDKANCRWWNLAALCQRCHLQIQAKVVLERVYPHEHSEWFKMHAAAWYAFSYLGEDLGRFETAQRLHELLALERTAA